MKAENILQHVVHSSYVSEILSKLSQNADMNKSFVTLSRDEILRARNEFNEEYSNVEIATYFAAESIFEMLLGRNPKITLKREGVAGYSESDLEYKLIETDFSGRWQDITSRSDEELTFTIDHTIESPQGMNFYPRKACIIVEANKDEVKPCEDCYSIGVRLKAKFKCVDKINDHFFGISHKYDKIKKNKKIQGITDFGGLRIIVKDEKACYEVFDTIAKVGCWFDVVDGSVKDYVKKPKRETNYQALHFLLDVCGYYVEVQIRSKEMNRYAETHPAAHHEESYEFAKREWRNQINKKTNGRLYRNRQQLFEMMKRQGCITI